MVKAKLICSIDWTAENSRSSRFLHLIFVTVFILPLLIILGCNIAIAKMVRAQWDDETWPNPVTIVGWVTLPDRGKGGTD